MSSSPEVPDPSFAHRGPMFWLPPHGFGDGIGASAWAEIADLADSELPEVLLALTEARIAGYVATVRTRALKPGAGETAYRLWVDSMRYHDAEDILMELLREPR